MSVPKSVVKMNKNGVQFVSSVDYYQYTIKELCRAALRDVGKYVCRTFKQSYYSVFTRKKGYVGKYTQYWVQYKKEAFPKAQIGIKPNAFYGGFQEFGTSNGQKYGLLRSAVHDNIDTIIKIESQYLSSLNDNPDGLISEEDYEGGADD